MGIKMKVAAIVVTYNDGFKFKEWTKHYEIYKDEVYKYVIVDNGSKKEYLDQVRGYFKDADILTRQDNGGCTAAYNDGIKHALKDPEVDAIMLIGNDMMLEKGGVTKLYEFLMSDKSYGMVAPIMFEKDSDVVADFGCGIKKSLYLEPFAVGERYNTIKVKKRIVSATTGGMNLSKVSFYKEVGLQDETLFMYSDEVDMGIRSKIAGYKMAVTSEVKSWHQHINPANSNRRLVYSDYLIGRNKLYLGWKHFGLPKVAYLFISQNLIFFKRFLSCIKNRKSQKPNFYYLWGVYSGLFRNMKMPSNIELP